MQLGVSRESDGRFAVTSILRAKQQYKAFQRGTAYFVITFHTAIIAWVFADFRVKTFTTGWREFIYYMLKLAFAFYPVLILLWFFNSIVVFPHANSGSIATIGLLYLWRLSFCSRFQLN